jgi:hypothetical protein
MGFVAATMAAVSAVSSISQGYQEKAEAEANARIVTSTAEVNANLLELQADAIGIKRNIGIGQAVRARGKSAATTRANIAASGQSMSGSAMAVMVSTQAQMLIDQAIIDYNFTTEKQYTLAEARGVRRDAASKAGEYRRQGKAARTRGYTNAFSTMLQGAAAASSYGSGKGTMDLKGQTKAFGGGVRPMKYDPVAASNASYTGYRRY